jgi:hypothetical protein
LSCKNHGIASISPGPSSLIILPGGAAEACDRRDNIEKEEEREEDEEEGREREEFQRELSSSNAAHL